MTPIVVTHEGGVRFAAQVRAHRVVVDQPAAGGGDDSGPMPLELIAASLATCIAFYVHQFLDARSLPHDGMRVEVDQTTARNPYRVAEYDVRVVLPATLPGEYAELLDRVVRSCPAHNTLQHSPRITVSVETPSVQMGRSGRRLVEQGGDRLTEAWQHRLSVQRIGLA